MLALAFALACGAQRGETGERIRCVAVQWKFLYLEPAAPRGAAVPVVVYLHGAGAVTLGPPSLQDAMLHQMAASGFLVVAPLYTEGNTLRPSTWETSAVEGVAAALAHVRSQGRVAPDMNRVAFVGESLGGLFALRLAHLAGGRSDLPAPRAIVLHDGAGYAFAPFYAHRLRDVRNWRYDTRRYECFPGVPDDTLLVALIAEETWNQETAEEFDGDCIFWGNTNAGGVVARAWHTTGIRPQNRHALMVRSDRSRCPPLLADHGVPTEPEDDIDDVFWSSTAAALAAVSTLQPPDFSANLSRCWPDGSPQLTPIIDVPAPRRFAWDCENILRAERRARWFLPRGACHSP